MFQSNILVILLEHFFSSLEAELNWFDSVWCRYIKQIERIPVELCCINSFSRIFIVLSSYSETEWNYIINSYRSIFEFRSYFASMFLFWSSICSLFIFLPFEIKCFFFWNHNELQWTDASKLGKRAFKYYL